MSFSLVPEPESGGEMKGEEGSNGVILNRVQGQEKMNVPAQTERAGPPSSNFFPSI